MEVETLIADTINNNPIKIKFRGKDMEIPRPTLGTLVEVSKHIAKLPEFDVKTETAVAVQQTLSIAKDCGKIAEILAIMILGKKNMTKELRICGITVRKVDRVKKLAAEIEDMTSQEIAEIMVAIFSSMDCARAPLYAHSAGRHAHLRQHAEGHGGGSAHGLEARRAVLPLCREHGMSVAHLENVPVHAN